MKDFLFSSCSANAAESHLLVIIVLAGFIFVFYFFLDIQKCLFHFIAKQNSLSIKNNLIIDFILIQ
jgi:hypothetical protein